MKRFLIVLIMVFTLFGTMAFATADENISGVEYLGEDDDYYDTYDEYGEEIPMVSDTEDYEISQLELKEKYEEQIVPYIKEVYAGYERSELVKARVKEASDISVEYQEDYYYGLVYKYTYQTLTLEVLEGEYKGKTYTDVVYNLTEDGYGNIVVSPVNKGSYLYVSMQSDYDGSEIQPKIVEADTAVDRGAWIITLILITMVVVAIVGRKAGVKALIPAILIVDLILLVTLPELMNSTSAIIMGAISSILIVFVNTVVRNDFKFSKKIFITMFVSLVVVLFAVLFTYGFDAVAKINGTTMEAETLATILITGNGNFHALYVFIIMVITAVVASDTACKTMEKLSTVENGSFSHLLSAVQDVTIDNMNLIVVITIAFALPKFMVYTGDKYLINEMINSERLILEVARMLILIISMVITVPLTILAWKLISPKKQVENV